MDHLAEECAKSTAPSLVSTMVLENETVFTPVAPSRGSTLRSSRTRRKREFARTFRARRILQAVGGASSSSGAGRIAREGTLPETRRIPTETRTIASMAGGIPTRHRRARSRFGAVPSSKWRIATFARGASPVSEPTGSVVRVSSPEPGGPSSLPTGISPSDIKIMTCARRTASDARITPHGVGTIRLRARTTALCRSSLRLTGRTTES